MFESSRSLPVSFYGNICSKSQFFNESINLYLTMQRLIMIKTNYEQAKLFILIPQPLDFKRVRSNWTTKKKH